MAIIEVDANEKGIIEILTRKGIEFETTGSADTIGDLRCDDTVIERKEINDFIGSMGPHLVNQYLDMTQYPVKALIIVGFHKDIKFNNLQKYYIGFHGMIARLARQGVTVIQVGTEEELVRVALAFLSKAEKLPEGARIQKRRGDPVRNIIDSAAPRISKKSRDALLKKYGSPLNIANASMKELQDTDGVGKTIAQKLYNNFRGLKEGE